MAPVAMGQDAFALLLPPIHSYDCHLLVQQFAACRTAELGGRLLRCRECGTQIVEYNRCNARGCPGCGPERQAEWRQRISRQVLPIGHFHLIFSGPEYLAGVWLADSRKLMNALFSAAGSALKTMMKEAGLTFGLIMVFQSHGRGLSYKPHIHCLLTPGGVDGNRQWREYKRIAENRLRQEFRSQMLKRLPACAPRYLQHQIAQDAEEDWSVYCVLHRHSPEAVVTYLSRTLFGLVVDTRYPLQLEGQMVTLTEEHHGKRVKTTLSDDLFIQRYFAHIPAPNAVTVRHYGLYSNRMGMQREALREAMAETAQLAEPDGQPECPECHAPMEVTHVFSAEQLPTILRLYRVARGSPPPHRSRISLPPSAALA